MCVCLCNRRGYTWSDFALCAAQNLPLYLLTWKIAPAIAVGNCCVAKPSELSGVTAWMLGRVLNDAGVPPGVVSIFNCVRM